MLGDGKSDENSEKRVSGLPCPVDTSPKAAVRPADVPLLSANTEDAAEVGNSPSTATSAEGGGYYDRRPARLAPAGAVLEWTVPSVFGPSSLWTVFSQAPISDLQVLLDGKEKHKLEAAGAVADIGDDSSAHIVARNSKVDAEGGVDESLMKQATPAGHAEEKSCSNADEVEPATQTENVAHSLPSVQSFLASWPKRSALPLLDFLDSSGVVVTTNDTDASLKVSSCRPKEGLSLRLDKLLAEGQDIPTQVWRCTVIPLGYTVLLKLLTEQAAKSPPDQYLPQEIYEQRDTSKASLGRNAQCALSREADMFKAMGPLQGSVVPYNYGFYPFTLPGGATVVGHVQEWVPSVNINDFFARHVKHDPELIDRFYTSLYQSYLAIHFHDVAQLDVGIRNMLLYPKDAAMRLVLIDFTMAISISNCEKNDGDWAFAEDISLYNCLDEELDRETYWEWLRTDRGELLEELAKRNHDELVRFYESRALLPAESLSCASGNAHDSADEGNSATPLAVDDLEEGQSSKRAAKPEPLLLVQKEFPPAGDTCLGDNSLKAISPGSGISPTSSTGSAKRTAELAFELRASSVPDDGSPKRPAIPSPKQSPRRLRSASRRSGSEGGSTKK